MRSIVLGLALLAPVLAISACFDFDEPVCSYRCGDGNACPDNYECRPDGYCHQIGSTEICPFTDAAVPDDLAVPDLPGPDLTSNGDASTVD